MATGIKDKVAIVGMGCSKFGERWNCGTEHLLAEAFQEAMQDAGIDKKQIGAAWFGSALDRANVGNSAIPLTMALRLEGIPVTRVENMCATGTEALRGAVYAVAGVCLLLNKRARLAATWTGLWILFIDVIVYGPIVVQSRDIVGLNYIADTLMYGGAVLCLALSLRE